MAVKVATGRAAERGQGGKTQGPVGHVRLEDTSAVAWPGAALTGAPKTSTAAWPGAALTGAPKTSTAAWPGATLTGAPKTSAVAWPGATLTGAEKPRDASRQNLDDRRSGVSDPARVFGSVQVGQGVEGLQRVALGREVEFGHCAVADAHIEFDGGLGRGAQNLPYCG